VRNRARVESTGISILHTGYSNPALVERKLERNLRLADRDCEERPLHPLPLYARALTLVEMGRASEALVASQLCKALGFGIGAATVRRDLPMLEARAFILDERLADALDVVRAALAFEPTDAMLLFLEARLMAALGDLTGAEARARAQLIVTGDHHAYAFVDRTLAQFRVRHFLAEVLLAGGRFHEAAEQAQHVVDARPMFGLAWLVLGEALLHAGRRTEFETVLGRLANVSGATLAREILEAERIVAEEDVNAALARVDAALETAPRELSLMRLRARLLHREATRHEELEDVLRIVRALDPLCIRSRALGRASGAPVGAHAERETWQRRASTALGPLL
jgi:tetratricopeptide (TPR) repeat protein